MSKRTDGVGYGGVAISGGAKAHLQHLLTAAAINLVRLSEWWAGTPLARTRCSRFAALEPAA